MYEGDAVEVDEMSSPVDTAAVPSVTFDNDDVNQTADDDDDDDGNDEVPLVAAAADSVCTLHVIIVILIISDLLHITAQYWIIHETLTTRTESQSTCHSQQLNHSAPVTHNIQLIISPSHSYHQSLQWMSVVV